MTSIVYSVRDSVHKRQWVCMRVRVCECVCIRGCVCAPPESNVRAVCDLVNPFLNNTIVDSLAYILVRPAVKRRLIFNRPTIESISLRYRRCRGNIVVVVVVVVVAPFSPFAARNERTFFFLFSWRNGPNIHIYIIYFFGFNERKELSSSQNTIQLVALIRIRLCCFGDVRRQ